MAKVILVLACGVIVFVVVSNFAPGLIEDFLPRSISSGAADPAPGPATPDSKTGKSVRNKGTTATRPNGQLPEAAIGSVDVSSPSGISASAPVNSSTRKVPMRGVFSVATESATLYSTNATAGPVVSQLRQGAVVEAQFTLYGAGQEWTFVNVADQKISGFVRSENLRKKEAEQTSR
jgi:hypothetical protein